MWPFIGSDADKVAGAEALDGPSMTAMQELAQELGIWIFPGSFAERAPVEGRVYNTALAIDSDGGIAAIYRKIHLFDVDVVGGVSFQESDTVAPGDEAVLVDTPLGRVGMTVCYDLRFPALYQRLREGGAELFSVPAAFTSHTGKDHWEVLLRARATENQCYVLAADQGGRHNRTRESHGQSMIVDPWGLVVGRASDGPGFAIAAVDTGRVASVRQQIPCFGHKRDFRLRIGVDKEAGPP